MPEFLLNLRDLLLLRRGPQDLPYAPRRLITIAALCVIAQTIAASILLASSTLTTLISAVLSVALTLIALNFMLGLRKLRSRFVQAATALLSSNLFFTLISVPLALLFGEKPTTPEQVTSTQLMLVPVLLVVSIWQVAVNANVLRHSLDIPFWGATSIVLLWGVVAVVLAGVGGV